MSSEVNLAAPVTEIVAAVSPEIYVCPNVRLTSLAAAVILKSVRLPAVVRSVTEALLKVNESTIPATLTVVNVVAAVRATVVVESKPVTAKVISRSS